MANDTIPPFLRSEPMESVALEPMYLTRWLVFVAKHGVDRWWQWCPVNLAGGIDEANVRWSRPRGALLPPSEEPNPTLPSDRRPSQSGPAWEFSEQPIASFDLPFLAPEP